MLTIGVITLFPEMFSALNHGVIGRALDNELLTLCYWNPRDYTHDTHQTVDDRPYGGGPGMVMKFEPLHAAIQAAKTELGQNTQVVQLCPQGQPLKQHIIAQQRKLDSLILLAGRYEGIDQRLINTTVNAQWSLGDYVVSGGELPAMIVIDAITRLLPGALGHENSADQDSFSNGLLDYPHYTRPETVAEQAVPKVLQSGDHAAITRWRLKQSLGRTWQKRPDLVKIRSLTAEEQQLLDEFIQENREPS